MQVFGLLGYTGEPAQAQAGRANCTPKAAPSPHMKLRDTQGGEKKKSQRKNNLKTNKQNKTRLKKKRKKKAHRSISLPCGSVTAQGNFHRNV